MPTPFICRKCTARLAKSAFRSLRPNKSPLHTRIIPAERPSHVVVPPAQHGPKSSQSRHPSVILTENGDGGDGGDGGDNGSTTPLHTTTSSQGQYGEVGEIATRWKGEIRKFIPKRTAATKQLASLPANNARELKAKILGAWGDYILFHGDLVSLYGLSHQEARHAGGQLERLLRGHLETKEVAARRLDQYLAWKKDFSAALRNVVAASSVQGDNSSTSDSKSEKASHESEPASMRTAWQRLDRERRERLWPQMVLSAAVSEPHTLPTLIQSTFDPSWCPSYVAEDMLYLLFRRRQLVLQKGDQGNCGQVQEIEAIATFILDRCPPRYLDLEQTVLHSTFSPLSTSELVRRYELLKTLEHPLHANTLLHLASRFAKGSDTKLYAVDIFRILTSMRGFNLNTPAAASVCTTLLTLNEHELLPDQKAAPDLLFEFLLKRGFRPNTLGLSALMRNFCIRGHLDTAWKIFDLMLQYGLEPDRYVYSILLNGSKQNLDSASFESIFNIITSRNAWSPVLVNDFLSLLFRENESQLERRRRQRKKVNNAWRPMLELYAKLYDVAPLQKFTLFPLENMVDTWSLQPKHLTPSTRLAESLMPQPDNRLMQPDTITLSLMIGAHMRSLLTPKYAIRYYVHFFNLVDRKDPTALSLLANHGTLMFDIFLRTLMQFRETTGFAIKEVLKRINAAKREKAQYGHNRHHHPPSVHTWTIVLNGFKNHNDVRGVIGILDMMTNIGGVQPTLPTWNALIQAFARTRNVSGAVKAVWSLEKAGLQPDNRTIEAFNMLPRNLKEQAIAQLEEVRKAPEIFSNTKASPQDSVTNPGVPKINRTHHLSSNDPIQRPKPVIPKTLKALARQRGKLDIQTIESRSKRRQVLRRSRASTPNSVGTLTGRRHGERYFKDIESPYICT
ncbi:hypothetical protein E0Z10_g86 [Xylaria hypoxylon]|uniref:Pentacotripeptide-repeat region of PRORP domain-containing protein n=1 Tax=Xylaria hypoxylon TaxID=37992 RepID=A0A4Z0Z9T9_9PEZI|nr:hypothetical protein E0Z10_g86 [Xylaria hypoxylon]